MCISIQHRATKIGRAAARSQTPRRRWAAAAAVADVSIKQPCCAPDHRIVGTALTPKPPGAVGLARRADVTPDTSGRHSSSVGSRLSSLRRRVRYSFSPPQDYAEWVAEATNQLPECATLEPHAQRTKVWPELFGEPEVTVFTDPGGYSLPQDVTAQIKKDVGRTQPALFAEPECELLRNVLSCFVAHNPSVGYCQGLNFIAAVFLRLSFDVATTFRGLSYILETCCSGYHDPELRGYKRDMKVMHVLAHQVLDEDTLERVKGLDAPMDVLALDHFITLTSRSWPLEATVRLWDLLLLKGPPALFGSFLAVLESYAPPLPLPGQATDDLEPVHEFQQAVLRGVRTDLDAILTRTWELMELIPQAKIDGLREAVDKSIQH